MCLGCGAPKIGLWKTSCQFSLCSVMNGALSVSLTQMGVRISSILILKLDKSSVIVLLKICIYKAPYVSYPHMEYVDNWAQNVCFSPFVCMCMCAREREKERDRFVLFLWKMYNHYHRWAEGIVVGLNEPRVLLADLNDVNHNWVSCDSRPNHIDFNDWLWQVTDSEAVSTQCKG